MARLLLLLLLVGCAATPEQLATGGVAVSVGSIAVIQRSPLDAAYGPEAKQVRRLTVTLPRCRHPRESGDPGRQLGPRFRGDDHRDRGSCTR